MRNRANLNNFFNRDRKTLYIVLSVLLVSVLTLTVVYAALSTTLNISGNAEVTAASWDIHFDNIQVNPASVTATTVPNKVDVRTINFGVTLTKPGDFYKFSVDIVNNGSIDAMIDSIVKIPELTSDQAKYIKYEIEYIDGNSINSKQLLSRGETKTISVLVSYRSDITVSDLPVTVTTLDLSFKMIYVQADSTGMVVPEGTEVKVVSGDLNTIGSEICIGEECFYLMNNDGRSITMLSKYNLYVGNYCTSKTSCSPYDNVSGIQNSSMIGFPTDSSYPRNGTIAYSVANYWSSTVSSYPAYVYDLNSNLYMPIENYKDYLEEMNVIIEEARLISKEELVKLGCSVNNKNCSSSIYPWVYSTSYWTGSAEDPIWLWYVNSGCHFDFDATFNNDFALGIRPVIKIPLTEF